MAENPKPRFAVFAGEREEFIRDSKVIGLDELLVWEHGLIWFEDLVKWDGMNDLLGRLDEWAKLVSIFGGSFAFFAVPIWKFFEWRRDRTISALKESAGLAEKKAAAHQEKIAELEAKILKLEAENSELRAKLGLKEWKPDPPGPFSVPHVEF